MDTKLIPLNANDLSIKYFLDKFGYNALLPGPLENGHFSLYRAYFAVWFALNCAVCNKKDIHMAKVRDFIFGQKLSF